MKIFSLQQDRFAALKDFNEAKKDCYRRYILPADQATDDYSVESEADDVNSDEDELEGKLLFPTSFPVHL